MKYFEKLRDPRWQRLRLEVMQRDSFTCLKCGDVTKTLNVHHKQYRANPWESPLEDLETLCEDCHTLRTKLNKLYLGLSTKAACLLWERERGLDQIIEQGNHAKLNSDAPFRVTSTERAASPSDLTCIAADIDACRRCGLCKERNKSVPGEGTSTPEVLFIGEGPGVDDDRLGQPFIGAAGQLLDKMLNAMGFARRDVFITNIVKCRPPGNRTPEPEEIAACLPFLKAQIAVLKPKVLCLLGNTSLKALFGQASPGITRLRGKRLEWQGIPAYPIFHPSYLLRNESGKKQAWEDMKLVLKEIGSRRLERAAEFSIEAPF